MANSAATPLWGKTAAYLVTLPRWFGLPGVVASVALGGVLTGQPPGIIALACLAGALIMAYAHSYNSFADWLSGLDQGAETERSHPKPYTSGQNIIAKGLVNLKEVGAVTLAYLVLSAIATMMLATYTTPWVWLAWGLATACAPLYSWGKFNFTCELWLALGFGPLSVMFGAAVAPGPEMAHAFLAGIPFGIVFGYMAELVDQWWDADVNVPKGLRNLGALCWQRSWRLRDLLAIMAGLTIIAQVFLINFDILSFVSVIAFSPLIALVFLAPAFEIKSKPGILAGLGVVLLYPFVILIGEAIR